MAHKQLFVSLFRIYEVLIEAVLKNSGYTVTVARNGEEALDVMDKEHIDLVVLDIMMPKMDGYEFTKTLRECDNNLPILMVSAKQLPAEKNKGFAVGTDDYMTKPVNQDEFLSLSPQTPALLRKKDEEFLKFFVLFVYKNCSKASICSLVGSGRCP